jgi:ribosomal protein L11 methyltransferase
MQPGSPKRREGGWPAIEISRLDDLVQAALVDHDVAAIDEDSSRVFFPTSDARDRALTNLQREFPDLTIFPVDVPDEDWAARSQATLKAVQVGNIVVAPPWDVGSAKRLPHGDGVAQGFSPAITIVIEPSMGFGTGHHATTRLCLAHLQQIDIRNQTVLDVGTGSGVLAIAASRLGASHVLAIDDDPDAIESARQNLAMNPGADVTLGAADIRGATLRPFDVVLANLTGGLLQAIAATLQHLVARDGRLVLSGFMNSEESPVINAFVSCTVEHRSQEDEWICATLIRSA